jgi:hypothetical protein
MNQQSRSLILQALALGSLVICAISLGAAAAPSKEKAGKSGAKTPAADAAPAELPQSVFTIPTNTKEGKDPFFPNRPVVAVAPGPKTTNPGPAVVSIKLTLKGISGSRQKPLAIINGRTFEKGEEAEIVTTGGRTRVRCVEIREDSVLIEVNGARQELRMRAGA